MTQNQGIVSILASDNHQRPTSLKRTLSADMSSKTWLAQNGFSLPPTPMKKVASSQQISTSDSNSSSDEEECELHPRQLDIWTAILSQKAQEDPSNLPPPYVHPLLKKSASSLSEKSLKVCTESLGSETGSDVFSSSEEQKQHQEEEEEEEEQQQQQEEEIKESDGAVESKVVKNTHLTTRKAQLARSFPPPLPSLPAARTDGPSLHMHSRRVDGRLVLEAVSIPSQNYFEAQRQDGRFLLTLINNPKEEAPKNDSKVEFEDLFDTSEEEKSEKDDDEDEEEEEEEEEDEDEIIGNFSDKNMGILKDREAPNLTGVLINMHRSTMTMKRIAERDNKAMNIVKLEVVKEDEATATPSPITQSLPPVTRATGLPPLPPPAVAAPFNSYQYFWRAKPTVASVIDPLTTQHRPPTKNKAYEKKDLVLVRGNKADCLLPSLKGCKEPRRSLLKWEPFCIATS